MKTSIVFLALLALLATTVLGYGYYDNFDEDTQSLGSVMYDSCRLVCGQKRAVCLKTSLQSGACLNKCNKVLSNCLTARFPQMTCLNKKADCMALNFNCVEPASLEKCESSKKVCDYWCDKKYA